MHFFIKYRKLLLVACLAIFIACDELPCNDQTGVQLKAGFYSFDGTTLADTLIGNLITHFGLEDNSIYSDTLFTKVQNIRFPLSMLADSSIVIFEFDKTTKDTLVFHYLKTLHLESHECGFVSFFELSSIDATNHLIDSVWISKNLIEYGDVENIKIYF